MAVWLTRAGSDGENEGLAPKEIRATVGFRDFGDFLDASHRDLIKGEL